MTKTTRARYTLEFKQEAVRLVEGGQSIAAAARTLGVVEQTLFNWVKAQRQGKLTGADSKPVSAEQMEISRLRAELARVKMERDILENRPRALPPPICIETRGAYTEAAPGQRPLAFWRHWSPSENLAQGKLRTQLWWHLE